MNINRIMKSILIAIVFLFCSFNVKASINHELFNAIQSTSLCDEDGWVEIGYITMRSPQNYQCYDGSKHSGYDISVLLYAKEFGNGSIIYRIKYRNVYYAVTKKKLEDETVRCSVVIDYQECKCNRVHKLRYEFII